MLTRLQSNSRQNCSKDKFQSFKVSKEGGSHTFTKAANVWGTRQAPIAPPNRAGVNSVAIANPG